MNKTTLVALGAAVVICGCTTPIQWPPWDEPPAPAPAKHTQPTAPEFVANIKVEITKNVAVFVANKQFVEAGDYLRDFRCSPTGYGPADQERITAAVAAIRQNLRNKIAQKIIDEQTKQLVAKVDAAIDKGDVAGARKIINGWGKTGCEDADFILVATRIGVMNCFVNWRDYDKTLDALKKLVPNPLPENVEELEKLEKEILAFDVRRVDVYNGVGEAIGQVVKELVALKFVPQEYEDEIVRYRRSVKRFLDARESAITERQFRDWTKYDEAVENVRKAILHHYGAQFDDALKVGHEPLTTADMNRKLEDAKNELLADVRMKIVNLRDELCKKAAADREALKKKEQEMLERKAAEDYRRAMNGMRNQVDLESQIAKAEHAFAKMSVGKHLNQHEIVDYAPILTEYSRVLRALDLSQRIGAADATAMLIGGAYLGELRVMKWAVRLGADIDGHVSIDANKTTALMMALLRGEFDAFEYLVSIRASFGAKDANGRTPIFYAAEGGDLPLFRLAALKSDVAVADMYGIRPAFVAARWNRVKLMNVLSNYDMGIGTPDKPILTKAGDSILEHASRHGAVKVMDWLYGKGWSASTDAIVKSILANQLASVKWHVEHGARVDDPKVVAAAGVMLKKCPNNIICEYLVSRGVKLENVKLEMK